MSQEQYGARRESNDKSKEKSNPWPLIIGGAALTGILGAGYLGYTLYEKVDTMIDDLGLTIDESIATLFNFAEVSKDGKLSYAEFDENFAFYFKQFWEFLESGTMEGKLDLAFAEITDDDINTTVNFDLDADGTNDLTLSRTLNKDGDFTYEYTDHNTLSDALRTELGVDDYRAYFETITGEDFSRDGKIGNSEN